MKLTILKSIAAITVLAALSISLPLPAQEVPSANGGPIHYSVINLGTLGGSFSNAYGGVTNRMWVTGDSALPSDETEHAFLWRDGVMTDLGTLGGPISSVGNQTKNVVGFIVGTAQTSEPDRLGESWVSITGLPVAQNLFKGFLWRNGVMRALPAPGGNQGAAYGVNNKGQVVGLAENSTHDANCVPPQQLDIEAVIWEPEREEVRELPPLPGDTIGAAFAINEKGQVVGGSGPTCGFLPFFTIYLAHAVLWRDGKVIDLGSLGGAQNNYAEVINNRGQVIGNSDLPGDNTGHGFIWQDGVMTDLGTLPYPLNFSSAAGDINEKAQVTGVSCDSSYSMCHGFIWENGVMTDLNNLLLPPGSPLQVAACCGINDRGEIAVDLFDPSTGNTTAYLAVPCDDAHASYEPCADSAASVPAAAQAVSKRTNIILPESIRQHLQKRSFGHFAGGPVKPQ
jgi:probable HAF family extracellular repeat protein